MIIKQAELENLVLTVMFEHTRSHGKELTALQIARAIDPNITVARVELAVGTLREEGFIASPTVFFMDDSPTVYKLTDAGYKEAERVAEAEFEESSPLLEMDRELAPASNRIVSFGDNQEVRSELQASVSKVEEIVRSSNTIEPDLKEKAQTSFSAWQVVIKDAKTFAIGAFKFMVWDRLKAVLGSAIEEAYKTVLIGIAFTIGALVVGLL